MSSDCLGNVSLLPAPSDSAAQELVQCNYALLFGIHNVSGPNNRTWTCEFVFENELKHTTLWSLATFLKQRKPNQDVEASRGLFLLSAKVKAKKR